MRSVLRVLVYVLAAALVSACESSEPALQVDAYIMADCPFSALAMNELMNSRARHPELKIVPHYVGTSKAGKISSIYGTNGLARDMDHVCALDQSGEAWLAWYECQLGGADKPYECAAPDLDEAKHRACLGTKRGRELLKDNYEASAARGINATPTFLINGKSYTGGHSQKHWTKAFCDGPAAPRRPECREAKKGHLVAATILSDCTACDPTRVQSFLESAIADLDPKKLSRAEASAQGLLPDVTAAVVAILSPAVADDAYAFARLKRHLRKLTTGDYALIVEPLAQNAAEPRP